MVFSSIIFLCYFLPLFLLIYFFLPKRFKNYFILLSSIFFYSWGAPKFIFILLASTFIDFYLVQFMDRYKEGQSKKVLLALSILLNVGLLAYFKYANFFIDNVNVLLENAGMQSVHLHKILLPIGISFYTFQTLTYSIDVYRKVHAPLKRVSDYMLYIMMFPQLIAGPIVRFNHIADQLVEREETINEWLSGLFRFIIGLSKKVLIANVLAIQADEIMSASNFNDLDSATAWIGILAYTFHIYFDFSGYSDMAIGIGKMLGFNFPENFNSPYVSKNISEFWRRWHITLGAWMKDYLYIPLGGNRVGSKSRLYFNLWIVFLISGLWHGSSWNFVIWGALHGLMLILDRLFLIKFLKSIGSFSSILITFFITMLAWVIFKIEDMSQAILYYKRLFAFDFEHFECSAGKEFYFILLVAVVFSFWSVLPNIQNLSARLYAKNLEPKILFRSAIFCTALYFLSLASLSTSGFNPFIYFRF